MIVETRLPVLLSVTREANKPRHPTVHGILKAVEKEIKVWRCKDIGVEKDEVGLAGSPTNVSDIFALEFKRMKIILKGKPAEVSRELFEKLHKLGLF